MQFSHESLQVRLGRRTGIPIIIGVHSTVLGPAAGGCRVRHYPDITDAIADCLKLSEAMTYKTASVDNGTGGGKCVAAVPADWAGFADKAARVPLFLDIAEFVEDHGGAYHVAPDVGSSPEDMATVYRLTKYISGLPTYLGGSGGTAGGTVVGLLAAVKLSASRVFHTDSLAGLRIAVQGLGGVGGPLFDLLVQEGAILTATDVNPAKQAHVEAAGATWVGPEDILTQECDILVPCALGGILNETTVPELRCKLIVGAANNQLASNDIEDQIAARGIVYVPDFVANAGGAAFSTGVEIHGRSIEGAEQSIVERITATLNRAFDDHEQTGISLTTSAYRQAGQRLLDGGFTGTPPFMD